MRLRWGRAVGKDAENQIDGPGGADDARLALLADRVRQLPRDIDLRLRYAAELLTVDPRRAAEQALTAVGLEKKEDPAVLIRAAHVLIGARETDAANECVERAHDSVRELAVTGTARQRAASDLLRVELQRLRERIIEMRKLEKRMARLRAVRSLGPAATSSQTPVRGRR